VPKSDLQVVLDHHRLRITTCSIYANPAPPTLGSPGGRVTRPCSLP